jgi:hypothetical protein
MLPARPPRYRVRPPTRIHRSRRVRDDALGCIVVRRITDDAGRAWRVREFHSAAGVGLFFRCDVAGIRSETRAAFAPLESLDDERLVDLLQSEAE